MSIYNNLANQNISHTLWFDDARGILDVQFANLELQRLYTDNVGAEQYSAETVRLFRRRIRHIEASRDLEDLRTAGGVRCEDIGDPREGRCSLALNEPYRLVVSHQDSQGKKPILVHAIALQEAGTS